MLLINFQDSIISDTFNEKIAKRKNVQGTIHSDQGFRYTSYEYKAICKSNELQISMSRKDTPFDKIVQYKKIKK